MGGGGFGAIGAAAGGFGGNAAVDADAVVAVGHVELFA